MRPVVSFDAKKLLAQSVRSSVVTVPVTRSSERTYCKCKKQTKKRIGKCNIYKRFFYIQLLVQSSILD